MNVIKLLAPPPCKKDIFIENKHRSLWLHANHFNRFEKCANIFVGIPSVFTVYTDCSVSTICRLEMLINISTAIYCRLSSMFPLFKHALLPQNKPYIKHPLWCLLLRFRENRCCLSVLASGCTLFCSAVFFPNISSQK